MSDAAPHGPPGWPLAPPAARQGPTRWPGLAAVAISLVALGIAIGAWVRPMPEGGSSPGESPPAFTDDQIAQAKANVCEAYRVVDRAVVLNTHRTNPVPGDEIGALATGAHGVIALFASGDYLLDRLAAEPATPRTLAARTESLGNSLKKFGMIVLAGEPETERDLLRGAVDTDSATIESLCK